ncbi:MAG: hypothetical protein FJ096_03580, partial [Deltaproteobacteria bacterium]|nr:hypothetical protein [Deltaproteobacteria bacterium]
MRRSLLTVGFVGLAAFATGTSACNQILGSFDPGSGGATSSATDTAATSTAIGSGGSSGVGGGMGEPRFDYACSFALAEPRVLTQISAAGGAYIDRLLVAERGNSGSPRVLVHVANATTGDLTAINADAPDQSFSAKNVLEVLDIKRLSATATGILAMVGGVGGFSLALLELPDGKDQFIERILLPPANLPVDKSNPNFSGAFVSLKPNEANWSVDVVVAFKTTTGVYNARYGNFTVMGGKTVSFIDPMNPLAQGGVRVFTAFRSQSKDRTFAYLAPNQEGAATFEFALDPAVTGAVPPRDYGGGLVLAAVERPTGFNIATIAFQTT